MPRADPLRRIDTAVKRRQEAQAKLEQANRELALRAKDAMWEHTGERVAKRVGMSRQRLYKFMAQWLPEEADQLKP